MRQRSTRPMNFDPKTVIFRWRGLGGLGSTGDPMTPFERRAYIIPGTYHGAPQRLEDMPTLRIDLVDLRGGDVIESTEHTPSPLTEDQLKSFASFDALEKFIWEEKQKQKMARIKMERKGEYPESLICSTQGAAA